MKFFGGSVGVCADLVARATDDDDESRNSRIQSK